MCERHADVLAAKSFLGFSFVSADQNIAIYGLGEPTSYYCSIKVNYINTLNDNSPASREVLFFFFNNLTGLFSYDFATLRDKYSTPQCPPHIFNYVGTAPARNIVRVIALSGCARYLLLKRQNFF